MFLLSDFKAEEDGLQFYIIHVLHFFCLEFYSWLLEVVGCDIHGGIVRGNKEYLILINLTNKNSHK